MVLIRVCFRGVVQGGCHRHFGGPNERFCVCLTNRGSARRVSASNWAHDDYLQQFWCRNDISDFHKANRGARKMSVRKNIQGCRNRVVIKRIENPAVGCPSFAIDKFSFLHASADFSMDAYYNTCRICFAFCMNNLSNPKLGCPTGEAVPLGRNRGGAEWCASGKTSRFRPPRQCKHPSLSAFRRHAQRKSHVNRTRRVQNPGTPRAGRLGAGLGAGHGEAGRGEAGGQGGTRRGEAPRG